jgi:hypothetical protein
LIQANERKMQLLEHRIAKATMELQGEKRTFLDQNIPQPFLAKQWLGKMAYEKWETEWKKRTLYRKRQLEDGSTEVVNVINAEKTHLIPSGENCNCTDRRHLLIQCRHELCLNDGKFDIVRNAPRWHRMLGVPLCNRANPLMVEDGVSEDIPVHQEGADDDHVPEIHTNLDVDEGEQGTLGVSQMLGAQTLPRARIRMTYFELSELATHLVEMAMSTNEEKRHQVAGFLSMGIEALKKTEGLQTLSLQESADKFVTAQLDYSPATGNEVFIQSSDEQNDEEIPLGTLIEKAGTGVVPPTRFASNPRGKPRKRLRGMVELNRDRATTRKKDKRQCTFCGLPDHNIATCERKGGLGIPLKIYQQEQIFYNDSRMVHPHMI